LKVIANCGAGAIIFTRIKAGAARNRTFIIGVNSPSAVVGSWTICIGSTQKQVCVVYRV